jgi:cytochrome c oxidase subunit I+III
MGMPRRVYTYDADFGWGIYNLISTAGVLLLIVPGIAIFVLNVFRSYRRGEPAGNNPWGADSLEWATTSPPAEHGWSVLPIIRSRHPLWDQDDLHRGDARMERFVNALSEWPLRWRAAVIVGTANGRPQEVFRVSDPSIWPLFAAGGVVLIFIAELVKFRWGAAVGALVIIGSAIMWNWPQDPPMTAEEEDAFEREHHVAVNAGGSVVVATWGMGLAILFVAIAFGALLLGYFYLRLQNPQWPPSGVAEPSFNMAGIAAALVVAGGIAIHLALQRLKAANQRGFVMGLVGAVLLAVAGLMLQAFDLARIEFGGTEHAFGSIFFTLAGFATTVLGAAIIMGVMTLFWSLRGQYTARRHANVANIVRFWTAAGTVWVITFGTLYLGPHLT